MEDRVQAELRRVGSAGQREAWKPVVRFGALKKYWMKDG
jgi:hypothetical protein